MTRVLTACISELYLFSMIVFYGVLSDELSDLPISAARQVGGLYQPIRAQSSDMEARIAELESTVSSLEERLRSVEAAVGITSTTAIANKKANVRSGPG